MWIKICGLRDAAAVGAAAEAGADALGFIFADSRRRVEPPEVRDWTKGLALERIGVFVDSSAPVIATVAETAGLTGVQAYDPAALLELRRLRPDLRLLRAVSLLPADPDPVLSPGEPVVLDSRHGEQLGGTGRLGDWERARRMASRVPVILAGGLGPENVWAALEAVRPWGVDVSSGVETEGRKDPVRIRRFIEEARRWEHEHTGRAG